jgi:LmbE family N-acetylglucosaminyl deacetylase
MSPRERDDVNGQSILILAPHPDDEVLAAGGVIQQHLARGQQVHVALLTSGDAQRLGTLWSARRFLALGERRYEESLRALELLGVAAQHVYRLGYPDRALELLWADHWHWKESRPFRSKYTKTDHVPYKKAISPGASYHGWSLVGDLQKLFSRLRPDRIYLPHPCDLHGDHWATHALATYALEQLAHSDRSVPARQSRALYTYLIHRPYWPLPRGKNLRRPLRPPRSLQALDTQWQTAELTAAQTQRKYESIRRYETQMRLIDDHLVNFARRNELFGLVPPLCLDGCGAPLAPDQSALQRLTQPLIYIDAGRGGLLARLQPGASLRAVHLERRPARFSCEARFSGRLPAQSEVRFHLKPIRRDGSGFVLALRGDRLQLNDRPVDERFGAVREQRSVHVQMPVELFAEARRILLGIEVRHFGRRWAQSAYRLIELE